MEQSRAWKADQCEQREKLGRGSQAGMFLAGWLTLASANWSQFPPGTGAAPGCGITAQDGLGDSTPLLAGTDFCVRQRHPHQIVFSQHFPGFPAGLGGQEIPWGGRALQAAPEASQGGNFAVRARLRGVRITQEREKSPKNPFEP